MIHVGLRSFSERLVAGVRTNTEHLTIFRLDHDFSVATYFIALFMTFYMPIKVRFFRMKEVGKLRDAPTGTNSKAGHVWPCLGICPGSTQPLY